MTQPSDTPQIEHPAAEFQGADDLVKLLPCPFCGGPVKLELAHIQRHEHYGERQFYGVVCRNTTNLGGTCCMEQVPSASKEAAIARWNMRAQNALIEQQAKRIEELEVDIAELDHAQQVAADLIEKNTKLEAELAAIKSVGMEPVARVAATNDFEAVVEWGLNPLPRGSELFYAAQLAKLQSERNEAKAELLALHEILMCPGECPPIAEGDTLTVRLLKGYVAAVDMRVEDQAAQIALAQEALEKINHKMTVGLLAGTHAKEMQASQVISYEALSTLTTGNAVQAIEARALREAADKFDAEDERELFSGGIADELRELAEQKEKGDAGVMEGK